MTDLERAVADVAFIRERLAASTRFDGLAPQAVALSGVLALAVWAAQHLWPQALTADSPRYAQTWIAAAVLAVTLIGGEAIGRSRRLHGSMADTLIASSLRVLLPFAAAGAVVTLVLLHLASDGAWLLPGLWQLLIALAGVVAVPMLSRAILWPSAWYFASGTVVLAIAAQQHAAAPWMMGLPFAIGQLGVALVLRGERQRGHG